MREQRRKENAERLRAASAKKREERIAQLQSDVTSYQNLLDSRSDGTISEAQFKSELRRGGFLNEADFNSTFESLQKKLNRMLGTSPEVEEKKTEEEIYPLINIPDEELSAELIKEKRRQKLLKAGFDARMRKKKEQEEKRKKEQEAMELEEQERLADPVRYIAKLKSLKSTIVGKRETRHRILQQMSSGSKRIDVASKKRMAIIARIAGEQSSRPNQDEDDDLFGMKDEDWQIYHTLAGNEESASEEEREELAQIELKLAQFDPDYVPEATEPKHPVVTAQDYQIHLGVSRIRPPELIFQPSMLGLDEGGVPESMRRILVRVSPEEASQLAGNVFVTGGNTLFPNFDDRLRTELTSLRPVGSTIRIYHAQDSLLDAWRGASLLASLWAKSKAVDLTFITKRQYEECGSEYLAEHRFSNMYIPTPNMSDEQSEAVARNRKRRR
jgi:actin-related protein 5